MTYPERRKKLLAEIENLQQNIKDNPGSRQAGICKGELQNRLRMLTRLEANCG
jgi:hypothetical protein